MAPWFQNPEPAKAHSASPDPLGFMGPTFKERGKKRKRATEKEGQVNTKQEKEKKETKREEKWKKEK